MIEDGGLRIEGDGGSRVADRDSEISNLKFEI
jgi:hypothetical protein